MKKEQIIEKIYPLYLSVFKQLKDFQQTIKKLETKKNENTARYFMIASLRLIDSKLCQKNQPVVANLLSYIAVETLCNNLAYFKKTKGIKHKDFSVNYKIEKQINKTKEFQDFLNTYCPKQLKQKINFRKQMDGLDVPSSFKDVLRYLYLRNRCVIVHKGLFRNIEENTLSTDVFIDANGKKCCVSIDFPNSCLTKWLHQVVKESFKEFLLKTI